MKELQEMSDFEKKVILTTQNLNLTNNDFLKIIKNTYYTNDIKEKVIIHLFNQIKKVGTGTILYMYNKFQYTDLLYDCGIQTLSYDIDIYSDFKYTMINQNKVFNILQTSNIPRYSTFESNKIDEAVIILGTTTSKQLKFIHIDLILDVLNLIKLNLFPIHKIKEFMNLIENSEIINAVKSIQKNTKEILCKK